jgi:hypothetical protein
MGAETSARTLPHFRRQPRRPRPDVPVADGQSERPTLGVTARMPVLAGSAIGALAEPPPTRRAVGARAESASQLWPRRQVPLSHCPRPSVCPSCSLRALMSEVRKAVPV